MALNYFVTTTKVVGKKRIRSSFEDRPGDWNRPPDLCTVSFPVRSHL